MKKLLSLIFLSIPVYAGHGIDSCSTAFSPLPTPPQVTRLTVQLPNSVSLPNGRVLVGDYTDTGAVQIKCYIRLQNILDSAFGNQGTVIEQRLHNPVTMQVDISGSFTLSGWRDNDLITIVYRADGTVNSAIGDNGVLITSR